jgi:hypothetical protein
MQKCLVLCKTLDIFADFYGQENGQMGKIVDKENRKLLGFECALHSKP